MTSSGAADGGVLHAGEYATAAAPRGGDPRQLERPPWSALTTTHSAFALRNDLACRYRPDIAPMAGVREVSEACLEALAALMALGDVVGLFDAMPVPPGRNLAVLMHKAIEQMVYAGSEIAPVAGEFVSLTSADVPAMMQLAELTKPGPFATRAIVLGSYIGIRSGDQLVAMAGERMRFDGFTEISAVCTHPDHRGRGHAVLLVSALMRNILARGETPFLHIFSNNTSAAGLYRKLGFACRRSLTVTVLKRSDQTEVRER
jgi:ribosomal protein S18 acetylase RimI-like enzyme